MAETSLELPHTIRSYLVDNVNPSEFKAPIGNVVGLFVNGSKPYVVMEHTNRFVDTVKYKVQIIRDGETADIKRYIYVGSFLRPPNIKHVYITSEHEDGDTLLTIPR